MTVALYCRVSTDEQAKEGFSLEAQKEILMAYCKIHGWSEHKLYIDDGYTGSTLDRPGLQRLLHNIQQGRISHVVIMKLDRLSRSQKDTLYLIEDVFLPNDVGFHSARETLDTTTPVGKLMIGILSSFAQFERETLIERTTMGRRQRANNGLWYGGRVPFGYDWDKESQALIINEQQAGIVREIYKRFLQGHAYNAIADWVHNRTSDLYIDHTRIREILSRPIYTGRMNNAGNLVEGKHEAIIDIDTWEKVQNEMELRKDGRTPVGTYLLSGLLECGVCGGPVIHIHVRKRRNPNEYYHYYACRRQHVKPKGWTRSCSLGFKPQDELENYVVDKLKTYALEPKAARKMIAKYRDDEYADTTVVTQLKQELADIDSKLDRWYDAFEEGKLNPDQVRSRIDSLEQQRRTINVRLDELEVVPTTDRSEDVLETLQIIGQSWDYMTLEEQQVVLRTALRKIILRFGDEEPTFEWNT